MATTTALDLISRPSQAPAGSRRVGGRREGATAVRFEDVLRELDRAGQPATDGGSQSRGTGSSGEGVPAATQPAPGTDGAKAPAEEPEGQDARGEGKEAPVAAPADATVQTAQGASEGALPTALLETGAEGTGQGPEVPVATVPGEGAGPAQPAGTLERAVLGAGASLAPMGPEAGQGLPGQGQGEPPAAAPPAEGGPVGGEAPVPEPGTPPVQGTTAVPGPNGPIPTLEPDLGLPLEAQVPLKEGKAQGRLRLPSGGEAGPEGLAEALLKGLAGERHASAAAPGAQVAEGIGHAVHLGPEALTSHQGRAEGHVQAGPVPQGEGEASPGEKAHLTWNQLLEEMGLRLEAGAPDQPESRAPGAEPASRPGAQAGQPAIPSGADGEPAPVPAQGTTGAQAPAGTGAEGQAGVTAVEITSPTTGSAAAPRADGGVATPFAQVGDVVVKRLQQLRNPGSDELRLELEPKELGSLKIRLELRGDGVKAQFVVDRPVVQAMLDRAMAELRQNLADQGYQVKELQVALQGDEGHGREPFDDRENRAPGRARGLRAGAVEGAAVPEAGALRWTPYAGPGRIDIRA